jgi:DNA-binding transcriptional MerR regulator
MPPTELFMIGELADRTARSVHAIRWYETQGLMPGVQRNGGGRRLYNERHVDWLLLMERLRRTGMSIAQMRAYTALVKQGRGTLAQRRDMLAQHRERVLRTIQEWSEALQLLDRKLDFYGEWVATGQRPRQAPELASQQARQAAIKAARPVRRRRTP